MYFPEKTLQRRQIEGGIEKTAGQLMLQLYNIYTYILHIYIAIKSNLFVRQNSFADFSVHFHRVQFETTRSLAGGGGAALVPFL